MTSLGEVLQGDGPGRAITDFVSRFGLRLDSSELPRETEGRARESDQIFSIRALPSFLTLLSRQTAPMMLGLGPVVGANVTFLGERLGCKLFVEDLFADDRSNLAGRAAPPSGQRRFWARD